ncbi:MAG: hypothetical protein U0359_01175 [Byssovorax sp.]
MRLGPWLAVTAVALSVTVSAAADPAAAEALFREGRAAAARGDWAVACAKLAESQRLDPAPGTLINLADCEAHRGLVATAWAHYHEAADHLNGDERLPLVKERMAAIEPRLSRLTTALAPGAPAGTSVTRDGEPLGPASYGTALPIDPGEHVLEIAARGRKPARIVVALREGEARSLDVAPGAALPPGAPEGAPSADPPSSSAALRTAGYAVGAVGLLSLGAGVATGLLTLQRKSVVDAQCVDKACSPEGVQAAAEGKALSIASTSTFIAGLAGVGAGVTMVILGSRSPSPAALVPALGPGHAGLVLHGSF